MKNKLVITCMVIFAGLIGGITPSFANAEKEHSSYLSSWQAGKSKNTIVSFVESVTQQNGVHFVEPKERIAVFDNDGTLWAEQPLYSQLMFAIEQIYVLAIKHPEWQNQEPFSSILKGDIPGALGQGEKAVLDIVLAANTGMTDEAYNETVQAWFSRAKHPENQTAYSKMVYQPMLELIAYLHHHEFKVFIVSGGGIQFIRAFSQEMYGIPTERVIGSTMKRIYNMEDEEKKIIRQPKMNFYNNNANKVIAINTHIGKRPILAFGNSDGDLPMLEYTLDGQGKRLAMLIHHTDEKREWAYDRESKIGHLQKGLDQATAKGWLLVDMKKDWKKIFN